MSSEEKKKDAKREPQLRFRGFTGPWEQRQLGNSFTFLRNNTYSRAELVDSDTGIGDVHYGDVLINFPETLDVAKMSMPTIQNPESIDRTDYLCSGDVVIADTAEDASVGKAIEISGAENRAVVAGLHTIPLRPHNRFAAGYLAYYLNSPSFHSSLFPLMQGIKVTSISRSALKTRTVRHPALPEQKNISCFFQTLDSLIAAAERQQELLKLQKLAYLQRMFPRNGEKKPRLRFSGFTGDWEQRQLKDVFTYERPDRVLTPNDCIEEQGKYPVLTANKTFVLGYTDNSQRIQNDIPRIIFDDFTMESKFADFPFSVRSSAIKLLKPRDKDNLYFLYLLLNTIHFPELGHARHYISYVQTQCVRVPNISEQNAIADLFKHFDSLIATTDSKIHALRRLKQGYMQQMFL